MVIYIYILIGGLEPWIFIFQNIWDLTNKNGGLEAWNFMTFHSVGDFIIPTDERHHFSEG